MQWIVRGGALAAVFFLAGCASDVDMSKVAAEKQYRTGSNIAQRDHDGVGQNLDTKSPNTTDPNFGLPSAGRLPRSFGGGQ
jgi:hypothetical protein